MTLVVVSILLLLGVLAATWAEDDCKSRDFGNGATVCVCTSEYCDVIERPQKVEQPNYLKYTSNKAGLRFRKETGTLKKTSALADKEITVNTLEQYQTIMGWGGAFTDSTGINIKALDEATQEILLRAYFSDEGLEYSLCRVPIGGTDFSTHGYSYDDGDPDEELKNFKLAPEDFQYKLPYIKRALNLTRNNLELFASAWTAPKWMKTNGDYAGFGFLLDAMYQPWADYFVKFLDLYQEQGIKFWGITTGNEPSLGLIPFGRINSVAWLPDKMAQWVASNLGPTIRKSNHSDIKIMAIDDQRFVLPWYANIVLGNNLTNHYIDGIAVHWYYDTIFPPSLLAETHNNFPDKFILATEACNGDKTYEPHVILGSWERGEKYAADIIQDLSNWVIGWVDWNMALNLTGGPTYIANNVDSPIIVNAEAGEFYKQPTYYSLGHFSKFVPRDSVRVHSSSFDENVPSVAFKRPDNGTVIVILNKKDEIVQTTVVDHLKGLIDLELSRRSITTILYW